MDKKKLVVLGLDGATWELLDIYMEKGYMPTLKRLTERGVRANLESTMPAMTAPSWTTFATGKNPGNHGIFDFMLPTKTLFDMKFATADDIRDKTIYELLKEQDYTPILINLPVTYPPKLDDDIMITSLMTQGDDWIFPASLKDEYEELKTYRLTPDEKLRLKNDDSAYIEDMKRHLDEQMAAVKRIFTDKPWDFFFYLFSHSDWISHLMYTKLLEEDNEQGRAIFEQIDAYLAWFEEQLPEDANLVLLSDHGFKAYKKIFYFNKWLESEGYLKTTNDGEGFRKSATRRSKEQDKASAGRKKVNVGSAMFNALGKVPFAESAARWAYHNILKKYVPVKFNVNIGIDFEGSKVCFPKGAYITNGYINKDWVYENGTVSKEEYPALVAELVEKISALKDPEGVPVVKNVLTREQVYGNNAPDQAPDLFFELGEYWLVGGFYSGKLFAQEIQDKHGQTGIFSGIGPDFAAGTRVETMDMQDVTPNLLHMLGMPVPADVDGQVRTELFAADSPAASAEVIEGPASRLSEEPVSEKGAIAAALGNIKL